MKNFEARLDRIEMEIQAKEPVAPIRIMRTIVAPGVGVVSALMEGKKLYRREGESEDGFNDRAMAWSKEISEVRDRRPVVRMIPGAELV